MQHHDAMTGTHMLDVGKDYLAMMAKVKKDALGSEGSNLASQIREGAKMHGIELGSMLYCEPDDYHTLNCDESSND